MKAPKDCTVLFIKTGFSFKILFTKPLKYINQLFAEYEHTAFYNMGKVYDSSGKNVRVMDWQDWVSEYITKHTHLYVIEPIIEISQNLKDNVADYAYFYEGTGYAVFEAMSSVLPNWIGRLFNTKKFYCSELSANCCSIVKLLPNDIKTETSPLELRLYLTSSDNTMLIKQYIC